MKKKTFDFKWIMLVVLSLMCFQQAEAYDVQTGGLYFNVTEYSDGRAVASVQNNGSFNTYSGYVVIPDSITWGLDSRGRHHDAERGILRLHKSCSHHAADDNVQHLQ